MTPACIRDFLMPVAEFSGGAGVPAREPGAENRQAAKAAVGGDGADGQRAVRQQIGGLLITLLLDVLVYRHSHFLAKQPIQVPLRKPGGLGNAVTGKAG